MELWGFPLELGWLHGWKKSRLGALQMMGFINFSLRLIFTFTFKW